MAPRRVVPLMTPARPTASDVAIETVEIILSCETSAGLSGDPAPFIFSPGAPTSRIRDPRSSNSSTRVHLQRSIVVEHLPAFGPESPSGTWWGFVGIAQVDHRIEPVASIREVRRPL